MIQERELHREQVHGDAGADRGGFVALAVIAAAVGAGAALLLAPKESGLRSIGSGAAATVAQLQREIQRRRHESRREKRMIGLAGLFIGAGLAALLTPQSGTATRRRLGSTMSRIKVGTVDRIERLRQRQNEGAATRDDAQVRSVQELGRDPDSVF
jgi:gas vesicle protein